MGFPLRTNSGSTQNLWGMRDYGFRGLWDKRASTVHSSDGVEYRMRDSAHGFAVTS